MSETRAAQLGFFDHTERTNQLQMKVEFEEREQEKHQQLADEHLRQSRKRALKAKELKKEIVKLSKLNFYYPPNSMFNPIIEDNLSEDNDAE